MANSPGWRYIQEFAGWIALVEDAMQCNASSKCVLNSDYELHEGERGFMGVEDPPMST